jgi:hypothetical protein
MEAVTSVHAAAVKALEDAEIANDKAKAADAKAEANTEAVASVLPAPMKT